MEILVLQHVACEPPGTYTPALEERAEIHTVLLGSELLPPLHPDRLAGIVVMGGPMGVYDTLEYPWLAAEVEYLAAAIVDEVPVFGVCLGSQLLAAALGGDVWRGESAEVGLGAVELTPAGRRDAVLGALPEVFPALQWHSDTFSLPPGATLLARSAAYPNQAICRGSAYGLQFHLEADWSLASEWLELPAYRQALVDVLGPSGPDELGDQLRRGSDELTGAASAVIERWLGAFVDPRLA